MDLQSEPPEEAREWLQNALLEEAYSSARDEYVTTILSVVVNIEDWVAIDSWLGGGKVEIAPSHERKFGVGFSEFRAVSTVISMAAELAEAAVEMAKRRRYYAVGANLRQLIECEYLLVWFGEDLDHAREWRESTPEAIRSSFTPRKMRRLTGFPNEEYWDHCSTGGHPAPKGARLLEKLDPLRKSWPYSAAELSIDLGLHLRRIWKAVDTLLAGHHSRYTVVRAEQRERAEEAWARWMEADPVVAMLTGSPRSTSATADGLE